MAYSSPWSQQSSAFQTSFSRASTSPIKEPTELPADEMSHESQNGPGSRISGSGSSVPVPNLPGSSLNNSVQQLRDTIDKRIQTVAYVKRAHGGKLYWFNTVLLGPEDLIQLYDHNRMRTKTTRFAILGMSLSGLLEIHQPHDFLKALLSLVQEFESVADDKFDRKNNRGLFRAASRAKKGGAMGSELTMGIPESNDTSYLFTPNIPFELDYFQVFLTSCDLLIEIYQKILSYLPNSSQNPNPTPSAFPAPPGMQARSVLAADRANSAAVSPAMIDVILKIDTRFKKMILTVSKELEGLARTTVKKEMDSIAGITGGLGALLDWEQPAE